MRSSSNMIILLTCLLACVSAASNVGNGGNVNLNKLMNSIHPKYSEEQSAALLQDFDRLIGDADEDAVELFDMDDKKPEIKKKDKKYDIWSVKKSDFDSIWSDYKESKSDLKSFLKENLACSLAPLTKDELKDIAKIKKKAFGSVSDDELEKILMRKSIKRHVALHYGQYLLDGGKQRRNFKVPYCQMIGLSTSKMNRNAKFLGQGGQGSVRKINIEGSPLEFIIKSFNGIMGQHSFTKEIKNLGLVEHPNIIQPTCFNYIKTGDHSNYQLILPAYTPNNPNKNFDLGKLQKYTAELAFGLYKMHAQSLIHLDMKPDNYVFASGAEKRKDIPVIIDFGLTTTISEIKTVKNKFQGTPIFLAPEQVWSTLPDDMLARQFFGLPKKFSVNKPLGRGTDWYNFGVSLFFEAAGLKNKKDMIAYVEENVNQDDPNQGFLKIVYPKSFPPELVAFLDMLLKPDVNDRDWSRDKSTFDKLLSAKLLTSFKYTPAWYENTWVLILIGVVVLIIGGGSLIFFLRSKRKEETFF